MRVRLAGDQTAKLAAGLVRAGRREIGGQLFGEQLAPSDFIVTELTIQARPGMISRFFVDLMQAARDAVRFFDRTGHCYTRYNYIGEWHSHPSYAVHPSGVDFDTMRALVGDPQFVGSFAVLMIVRIDGDRLTAGAWLFEPHGTESTIMLELQNDS